MMLFTYDSYRNLLDVIRESGYALHGIEKILISRKEGFTPKGKFVAIRHDIDYFPERARAIASIEAEKKIATTYYIRRRFFDSDLDLVREIAGLGHQIGYHYEEIDSHQKSPNQQIARDAVGFFVSSLLDIDQMGFPIRTVCAHGNPLTDVDNRQVVHLLRDEQFLSQIALDNDAEEIKNKVSNHLVGDASIDITGQDFDLYIPDTGRFNPKYNIKDKIDDCPIVGISDLKDLNAILGDSRYQRIYMNVHPDRWSGDMATWLFDFAFDSVKNRLKKIFGKRAYSGQLLGRKARSQQKATEKNIGEESDESPRSGS